MSTETSGPSSVGTTQMSTGNDQTSQVKQAAADGGREVAQEAKTQASAVVGEAKDQVRSLVDQTKQEVRSQLDSRTAEAANALQTLSTQLTALREGRPEEAGHVATIVGDAQQRLQSYASSLQSRGPQALVDDVSSFARRRPLMFLFGAAAAGFAVGRLVRAGQSSSHSHDGNGSLYGTRRAMDGGLSQTAIASPYGEPDLAAGMVAAP